MDLQSFSVSSDRTHHVRNGRPAYDARFIEVMKFHAPGLAPARDERGAFHIDIHGQAAYPQRHVRAFGFYEDLAAISADDGWHHIHPDGSPAYTERFSWCGNFQGGRCPVRTRDGSYAHILTDGAFLSSQSWRYAGDYRDGIAVVQGDDGRSTHINETGQLVHKRWFLDLDLFHKDFARARDEGGWTHIDRSGRPLYEHRFAMAEPFYNGQARVEREDGALIIIDERGETLVELRQARQDDLAALSRDLVGFWSTHTLYAAVDLGIFDALPDTAPGVARTCELDPKRSARLLRALGEIGVVIREGSQWRVTARGGYLRRDHPMTLADAAIDYATHFDPMWVALPDAIRAGGQWSPTKVFEWLAAKKGPQITAHHRALASYAAHDYEPVPKALPLRGDEHIIDAGGALGVLAGLLTRHHSALRVTVLDRPEVIERAPPDRDLRGRVRFVAADLFGPWGLSGDAIVLSRVIHDWDDDSARRILRRAREALLPGGRVFVIEMLIAVEGYGGALCDLHLLMVNGGQERDEAEMAALLSDTGFVLEQVIRLATLPSIVVGVAR